MTEKSKIDRTKKCAGAEASGACIVRHNTQVLVQLKCSLEDIEAHYKEEFSHSDNTLELARTKISQLFMDNNFRYIHVFNIVKIDDI